MMFEESAQRWKSHFISTPRAVTHLIHAFTSELSLSESHRPKHECGVFAVYGHKDAALLTYYGLFALQHRGQESAGIASGGLDGKPFHLHKGMGLVSQVFQQEDLSSLAGTRAIGHVRYSTTGSSTLLNSQPLGVDTARGQLAVAHNGNLVNAAALRAELESRGSIFQTTVDSEIVLHLLAQPDDTMGGPIGALRRLEGAFSLVVMGEQEIIGVRDPNGLRPLSLGKVDDAWVLSSETCAFDLIGAEFVRDLEPGEVVVINERGIRSEFPFSPAREAFCIFEYVYFARPDSRLRGATVSKVRSDSAAEAFLH
jgi:amidophosphoribosyltransferase